MTARKKTINKWPLLNKVVLALNIIATLALLLSYFAPITNPLDYPIIALLGFMYQLLLLVNVVLAAFWLFRSTKVFALISFISLLIGFNMFSLNYGFNSDKRPVNDTTAVLRVMQYNVNEFKSKIKDTYVDKEIINVISNEDPDILNTEEFLVKRADSVSIMNSIKKELKTPYAYFKPYELRQYYLAGNAIFSKYPIINSGFVKSANRLETKAIFADIKFKNKIIRIYCLHLAAVRINQADKSKYLNGGVNLFNTIPVAERLLAAFTERSLQVLDIKEHIKNCPYPYIIAGDFNDTPVSYTLNELAGGIKNTFKEKGSGFVSTYYNVFPKLHIDHILVSPQFDVLSYRVPPKKWSDHKPVITELRLK